MNQLQFEMDIIPTLIHKESKAEYIEALIASREADDINIFREFMFNEHARNIELRIENYKKSSEDDLTIDVPVNLTERELKIIDAIQEDSTITAKDLSIN